MAEVAVLCSGLMIYAGTGSSFMFLCAVFVPPLIMLGGFSYSIWVKNDYRKAGEGGS